MHHICSSFPDKLRKNPNILNNLTPINLSVKDFRPLRMVFPKQSRSSAFQTTKRLGQSHIVTRLFGMQGIYSEDLFRNQPRTEGRLSQKNTVLDYAIICDFMRLCSQGRTKTRLMSEKLTLILTTYCYHYSFW
jgi:hypothetical protein